MKLLAERENVRMLLAIRVEVPGWVEWLSGLSGPAAVLLTVTIVIREWLRRRREQAVRISAWATEVGPMRTETEEGMAIQGQRSHQSIRVVAHNASDAPVYDFHVWVHYSYAPDSGVMGSEWRHILPPGETTVWVDGIELPEGGLAGMPYVDLTFKDERGRHWQRLYDGGLGPDRISRDGRKRARWRP